MNSNKNETIERHETLSQKQHTEGVWFQENWPSGSHFAFLSLWVSMCFHSASYHVYFLQYRIISILLNNIYF